MATPNIAILDKTNTINFDYLTRIAAAIQKQIKYDFAPEWGKDALLRAFRDENEIPSDYWICYIMDTLPGDSSGLGGYHSYLVENNTKRPVIYVKKQEDYERTISHEILETLEDPYVDNLMLVKAIDAQRTGSIELLVEVADPVQNYKYGYTIDGIPVSNFFYRSFYDLYARKGIKYDHLGWLDKPRQLLDGGYISFKDASGVWWQAFNIGNQITFKKLLDKDASLTAREQIRAIQVVGICFLVIIIIIAIIKIIKKSRK